MKVLQRQLALARSFGVEFEVISPARGRRARSPLLRTDDLAGAVWIPGDGKANPDRPDACRWPRARASAARDRRRRRGRPASTRARRPRRRRRVAARRRRATIACEIVVNCAGQWARQFGALAGVNVPL